MVDVIRSRDGQLVEAKQVRGPECMNKSSVYAVRPLSTGKTSMTCCAGTWAHSPTDRRPSSTACILPRPGTDRAEEVAR